MSIKDTRLTKNYIILSKIIATGFVYKKLDSIYIDELVDPIELTKNAKQIYKSIYIVKGKKSDELYIIGKKCNYTLLYLILILTGKLTVHINSAGCNTKQAKIKKSFLAIDNDIDALTNMSVTTRLIKNTKSNKKYCIYEDNNMRFAIAPLLSILLSFRMLNESCKIDILYELNRLDREKVVKQIFKSFSGSFDFVTFVSSLIHDIRQQYDYDGDFENEYLISEILKYFNIYNVYL